MTQQIFMMTDEAIDELVNRISEKLQKSFELHGDSKENELLTIKEASKLINLAVPTIYGLVHKNEIPYSKGKKKLYFKKAELLEWVHSGKRTSKKDLDKKVDEYLFNNRLQK